MMKILLPILSIVLILVFMGLINVFKEKFKEDSVGRKIYGVVSIILLLVFCIFLVCLVISTNGTVPDFHGF